MKPQLALAFVVATAPAAFAQTTGAPTQQVDHTFAASKAKPSAATPVDGQDWPAPAAAPAAVAQPADEEFKPFKPYPGTEMTLRSHVEVDPDAGIVTDIPRRPNELPVGTALRARLRASIATQTTQENTPFSAELSEDVRDGQRVVLPAGSVVEGTVTQIRGGRRISGTALIHLQAQRVVLPDGTAMPLHAQVIDTDQFAETRIDSEGNIVRKDHAGATLATMSLTTGSAAAAGAVIGGGVGALIGAGIGAGLSTAVWLKQDRQARLPQDTLLIFSLTDSMDLKPQDPGFVSTPTLKPGHNAASAPVPPAPAAPAYVAPQAFVPTN